MVTEIRNLSRLIWIIVPDTTQLDHDNKIIHIKLLLGFAYACRHALLEESGVFHDFENLIPMDLKRFCAQESMCLPNQILYKVWPPLEYKVTWGDGEVGDDVEDEGGFTGEFGKGFFKGI